MSVSLEGRDPFLDHRIVEYAARIPMDMIYRNGQSKYILRRILYKHVPRELIERPKMGFNAPLHSWFEKDLSELLNTYLGEERLGKDGTFNAKAVSSMVRDFTNRKSVNINTLWSILMYEMWKEKWITN
jgi:asparagine synthase (glutamine-hydrolysing)